MMEYARLHKRNLVAGKALEFEIESREEPAARLRSCCHREKNVEMRADVIPDLPDFDFVRISAQ
jgi:hypothetical protein